MKKMRMEKGITLIALITTVFVLSILTALVITTVTNDEIKDKTKNTMNSYEVLQEKEKLQNEVMKWDLINKNGIPTLENYLVGIYGEENVKLNVDNSVTVTVPSGNRYIVTADGNVTLIDETISEPEVTNISVSLDKTTISKEITKGKITTETITATLNNATGKLTWISSDPDVAQIVTSEGNERIIKLKKEGTATITVAYADNKNIASVCTIEVIQPVNITLDKTTITKEIMHGAPETTTIAATLDVEGKVVTWSSSNTSVASIEGDGNTATVTLNAKGTATITASCGRYKATCTVTITEKPISIALDKTTITKAIISGNTATETITATLINAIGTVSWSSSNSTIASVVGNGNTATITFKKAGTATIIASFDGVTASCNVTVTVVSPPQIGDYADYAVSYTDINTGYNFTSRDGWRFLYTPTKNSDGTYEISIVSTGLPATTRWYYSEKYSWYGTYQQVNDEYGLSLTGWEEKSAGYFGAYGLKYNLASVPLVCKKINGSTTGTGSIFKVSGLNITEPIHCLRLDELNKARGYGSTSTTAVKTKDGDVGLFYLKNLENENANFGYTLTGEYEYSYWLATPYYEAAFGYRGMRTVVIKVNNSNQGTISHYIGFDNPNGTHGIRPVITISNVILTYDDGVWKISQ